MRLLTPENTGRDIVEKNDRERKKSETKMVLKDQKGKYRYGGKQRTSNMCMIRIPKETD